MQSLDLKKFVKKYSVSLAAEIWGRTRQNVEDSIKKKRDIQVVVVDGYVEMRESRLLARKKADKFGL